MITQKPKFHESEGVIEKASVIRSHVLDSDDVTHSHRPLAPDEGQIHFDAKRGNNIRHSVIRDPISDTSTDHRPLAPDEGQIHFDAKRGEMRHAPTQHNVENHETIRKKADGPGRAQLARRHHIQNISGSRQLTIPHESTIRFDHVMLEYSKKLKSQDASKVSSEEFGKEILRAMHEDGIVVQPSGKFRSPHITGASMQRMIEDSITEQPGSIEFLNQFKTMRADLLADTSLSFPKVDFGTESHFRQEAPEFRPSHRRIVNGMALRPHIEESFEHYPNGKGEHYRDGMRVPTRAPGVENIVSVPDPTQTFDEAMLRTRGSTIRRSDEFPSKRISIQEEQSTLRRPDLFSDAEFSSSIRTDTIRHSDRRTFEVST